MTRCSINIFYTFNNFFPLFPFTCTCGLESPPCSGKSTRYFHPLYPKSFHPPLLPLRVITSPLSACLFSLIKLSSSIRFNSFCNFLAVLFDISPSFFFSWFACLTRILIFSIVCFLDCAETRVYIEVSPSSHKQVDCLWWHGAVQVAIFQDSDSFYKRFCCSSHFRQIWQFAFAWFQLCQQVRDWQILWHVAVNRAAGPSKWFYYFDSSAQSSFASSFLPYCLSLHSFHILQFVSLWFASRGRAHGARLRAVRTERAERINLITYS